jgi:hypothetical protein
MGAVEKAYGLFSLDQQGRSSLERFKASGGESLYVVRDLKSIAKGESEADVSAWVIVSGKGNSSAVLQQDPQGEEKVYRFRLKKNANAWTIVSYQ